MSSTRLGTGVVVGLGFTTSATADEVRAALQTAVEAAGCAWSDVVEIATLDARRGHPALQCLDPRSDVEARRGGRAPVRFHSAAALAAVPAPNPSAAVGRAIGTRSVAEAAALASAGAVELLVAKRCTPHVCTAVVRTGASQRDPV